MNRTVLPIALVTLFAVSTHARAADWAPVKGRIMTRWASDVSPKDVHAEYPRPQMVRKQWTNLNGLWDYAIRPKGKPRPGEYDGNILVPFAIESALSGVMKKVGGENELWYRRTFTAKRNENKRWLLHFGAVDWQATVWVNGQQVGQHKGGYTPFSFDVTDQLTDAAEQELIVRVWDPTDKGFQPRGKQVENPGGIWYTAVTGIWQTVWLEPVPKTYIRSLKIVPDIDKGIARFDVDVVGGKAKRLLIDVSVTGARDSSHTEEVGEEFPTTSGVNIAPPGKHIDYPVFAEAKKLWSPSEPWLYDVEIEILENGNVVDRVTSYFGMRKIEIKKDSRGVNRMFLNNKPLFHFGPLDQGWWPDGLYTAPTDAALKYDIEVTKRLGFNMCRKHVKVEPARWYYWCDRLGLMVWQDMPNGDRHIRPGAADLKRSAESAANYRREFKELIDAFGNHPAIVTWVPFNEGWGQFETDKVLAWTKKYDPTRLVDGPSGWTDRGTGDIYDVHHYPGPAMPAVEKKRAVVLGEFGGLGLPVEGHLWWSKRNWGYRTYKTRGELRSNYARLMRKLRPLYAAGLAGAIYTQTTDVEGEVNGLMTYDRKIIKHTAEEVAAIHRKFYQPPPIIKITTLLASSEKKPQTWRYTTKKPADGWQKAGFDDTDWASGPGGFGTRTTPGTTVRTMWDTADIWIRRDFDHQGKIEGALSLRIHHDENAVVYLNGTRIASLDGYTSGYTEIELGEKAGKALRDGKNTLAVHCHQTVGGQYIDLGLVDVVEKPGKD